MSYSDDVTESTAITDSDHFCRIMRARREQNTGALLALAVEHGAAQMIALMLTRTDEARRDLSAFYQPWPTRWAADRE